MRNTGLVRFGVGVRFLVISVLALLSALPSAWAQAPAGVARDGVLSTTAAPAATTAHHVGHASVPLRFEPNRGQAAHDVRFIGTGPGYKVVLQSNQVTFTAQDQRFNRPVALSPSHQLSMSLIGARPNPDLSAFGELPGKSNYLLTSDRRTWITGVPTYSGVLYRGVYPKTDLVFRGSDCLTPDAPCLKSQASRLEYDFRIAPGGDPSAIAWRIAPQASRLTPKDSVRLDGGDLVIASSGGQFRFLKPVAYQEVNGKKQPVESKYLLHRDSTGATRVGFAIGHYDRRRALVIDPVLVYSTQFSGISIAQAMAVDSSGSVYLASAYNGLQIAKLAPDGSTVVYTTTIGTNSSDVRNIAIDGSGQVYVTGESASGLPTTANAYQISVTNGYHAFLTVVDPTGASLVYSSYLAGSSYEVGQGVTVDPSGKVLVAGWTESTDFPNTNAVPMNGTTTAFVASFDITQSGNASLLYSALLPSLNGYSQAYAVKSDAAGNAYAALSGEFNTTAGAYHFDALNFTSSGVYVSQLNSAGATQYLAYLGEGTVTDLAADDAGNAYVTGVVYSGDFPATQGAYQTSFPNAYLAKLNAGGASLAYSTYLGGPSGNLNPTSIAIPAGCTTNCTPMVAGYTSDTDFPVVNAIQNTLGGSYDAFLVSLTADGSAANIATYLGGTSDDADYYGSGYHMPDVGFDGAGNMYIAGDTNSADFPFTNQGTGYTFVTKISAAAGAMVLPDPYTLPFASQTLGVQSSPMVVNFRNYGTTAAIITSGPSSDNPAFTSTNSCGGSIPAGGFCAVQVFYTPNVAGNVSGTMSLGYNNGTGSATATVALTGYGYDRAQLQVTPGGSVNFGGVTVNTTGAAYTFTVTSVGSQPATITSIYLADTTNFKLISTNCPGVLAKGAACTFSLAFSPSTVGQLSTYYEVIANAYVTPNYYQYLYGTGNGAGTGGVTPWSTVLNFPDQVVGTTSDVLYAELQNTGTIPVTFGTASITGDFSIYYSYCNGVTVVPGDYCSVAVQFKPTTTGARTGTLTISNSAGPDQVISLSGNGLAAAAGLVFSPQTGVFSDQVVGTTSAAVNVTVTNTGNTPVTITRVYDNGGPFNLSSNGCLTTLSPYNTCSVSVRFAPSSAGSFAGNITFIDDGPGSPQTVSFTGNGIAPTSSLVATPSTATFDDTVVGSSGNTDYIYLYNQGNLAVTTSTAIPSSTDWTVTYNSCSTVYPAGTCEIDVLFTPQSATTITGTLTIPNSAPGSPLVVNLTGKGITAVNSIVANPLNLGFTDQVVGTVSSSQSISFYNPGNAPVTVTGASSLGGTNAGEFIITADYCNNATIQPGDSCPVYVEFSPTGSAGTRTATLSINDSAPGSPHAATLTGNAVNLIASLIATPASLGFDDQVTGTTSNSQIVTLYNPGNTDVTISNTAVSGDFAVTSACSSIPAYYYCNMYVTFSPTAAGQRTGTITLTDTASGSPHGISLYGNGLAASKTVAVFPLSVDFGNVLTSTNASTQTVYVLNTGTQSVTISPSPSATSPYIVSGCNTTLNPGVSCPITLSVNSSTAGSFPGTLTITEDATGSPQTVTLAANEVSTTPSVSFTPNGLSFDHLVVNTTSSLRSVGFTNHSGATITFTGISTTGDFAIVSNTCTTVANNGNCSVSVTFTPTAAGTRSGTLVFSQAAGANTINLTGYGDAATSEAQLSASALSFPDQVLGTTSSAQTVYVWNNGNTSLTVGAPTITMNPGTAPVDFAISASGCSSPVPPGSYCYFNLQYSPTVAGTANGTLSFTASDPGSPHSVTLNGVGVNPTSTMEPSATSVQFTDQVVGTTSGIITVYFSNTGNSPVTGRPSTITAGDFAIQYDGCNTTINVRSYCQVNLTFTPTASGNRTATLSVNNNAPGAPQTVSISGNGVTSTKSYRVTASALTFNDQPVGTQGYTQRLYFYNTGTSALNLTGTTLTGADFTIYDGCSTRTLSAGSSCYVDVTFQPSGTGPLTGSLSIGNDAPAGPAVISLSGNGVAPARLAHLSATSLVFADQAVGVTSPYQYVYIYNTGNVGVTVGTLTATGDFSLLYDNCSGYTISAGSYCTFYVTFTPTAAGARSGAINVPDNSTTSPHTLALSGNGLTPSLRISINPGNLIFPPTPTGSTSRYLQVDVSNVGNAPVQITSASVTGADFTINGNSCNGATLQPGSGSYYYSCYTQVQFQPTATGTLTGTLTFVDAATGSPQTVTLTGTGTDPTTAVQLSQNSITFADQPVGVNSPPAVVYMSNTGASTAIVSNVTVTGDYSVTGCPVGTYVYQYGTCAMSIKFLPTTTGSRPGSITITDNSASSPHVITLSGNGVTPFPIATLVPSSIAFGNVPIGQGSAYQSVILYNTGSAPLQVTGMVSSGPDFPLSTSCVTTISVGSACTFYVQFNPQAAGARSGSIQITDNASDSPQTLALTGTGIGSLVVLSPTTLNFGTQVVGTPAQQSFTLTNSGNVTLNISSITGGGDFTQTNNCPAALTGGGSCTVTVTFTPSVAGVRTGSISIVDDGFGSPQVVVVQGSGAQPQADLALTGSASPVTVPPNGSTTFTFTIVNDGLSTATGISFTATLPTNSTVTSVGSQGGECGVGATITCSLADLAPNASTTVSISATNTATGNMNTTGTVSTTQNETYLANNTATLSADAGVSDLSLSVLTAAPGPGYIFKISNSGPTSATNVMLTCAYNRYRYAGASSTQGGCSMNAGTLSCFIGNVSPGAVVNVTQSVLPPSQGWASIACHASANEYDPNPVNNIAQVSPEGADNTSAGDNVGVQLIDRYSGQTARVVFPSVRTGGATTLTGIAGAVAPAGFRTGAQPWTYDLTTTASTSGSPTVTFAIPAGQFHHPAKVRLFHLENGAWVDRTAVQDPATATVAAVSPSLSPFALFEPMNQAPVANPGNDRVAPANKTGGATVTLDAGGSTDADGDALTYRWTGPFPEGNGMVTGARPNVTLPFGASRVTLVVNDGETDSAPASVSLNVTDFGVAPVASSVDVVRGSSATIPVQVKAVGGAYDQAVTLGCSGLSANLRCTFSPATVQPGTAGASTSLTISSTTTTATARTHPATWGFAVMMFGCIGVFGWSDKRRRSMMIVGLVLVALLIGLQVGCGGGSVSGSSNQPAPNPTTTVTITVTGTSGSLAHGSNVTVTLH